MNNAIPDTVMLQFSTPTPAGELSRTAVEFIRKGAPSPWIDPKVQPIPERLEDSWLLWVNVKSINDEISPYITWLNVEQSREQQTAGRLIGYIILPLE